MLKEENNAAQKSPKATTFSVVAFAFGSLRYNRFSVPSLQNLGPFNNARFSVRTGVALPAWPTAAERKNSM